VGWAHPAEPTSLEWPLGGQSLAPNCLWPMHHHYLPIPQDPKHYIGARRFRYMHTLPPWHGLSYRGLKWCISSLAKKKRPWKVPPQLQYLKNVQIFFWLLFFRFLSFSFNNNLTLITFFFLDLKERSSGIISTSTLAEISLLWISNLSLCCFWWL